MAIGPFLSSEFNLKLSITLQCKLLDLDSNQELKMTFENSFVCLILDIS